MHLSLKFEELFHTLLDAGFSEQELNQQILAKRRGLEGNITKEGALHLIAEDAGLNIYAEVNAAIEQEIDFDEFTIAISEVKEVMRNIVIMGKIETYSGINDFVRKDGTPGVVGSFVLNDGTAKIEIVLWDVQTEIMKSEFFKKGELLRIIGGSSGLGLNGEIELHLGRKGKIILAPEDVNLDNFPLLKSLDIFSIRKSNGLKISDLHDYVGFIESLIATIKKIVEFKEIDKKNGEKTFLLRLVLNDNDSSIPINIWGMDAVNCLKTFNEGDKIILSHAQVKNNSFTKRNEIYFTKKTSLLLE